VNRLAILILPSAIIVIGCDADRRPTPDDIGAFDDIAGAACEAWRNLIARPDVIASIGKRDWAHVSVGQPQGLLVLLRRPMRANIVPAREPSWEAASHAS
jgi:hypothetical protein